MPTDVPIGAGYTGDVLFGAFPGQYRDTVQGPNAMAQPAAQTFVVQTRTDPDQGRPMALMDMPGVGQVVVPVEHTMVGVGMNAVMPVEHSVAGANGAPDLSALDGLGEPAKLGHCAQILSKVAARAAHEAARSSASMAQVEKHVRGQVAAAKERIEAALRRRLDKLPVIAERAVAEALRAVRGVPHRAAAPSHGTNGLGGIKDSILQLLAGKEMDQLASAMGKLQSGLSDAYGRLEALRKEEAEVNARIAGKPMWIYGPFGALLPTPLAISNMRALKSVDEGYRSLTGCD